MDWSLILGILVGILLSLIPLFNKFYPWLRKQAYEAIRKL
jgi:hypothetical protein